MWQSLRRILNLASLLRITTLTIVVSVAILAGFKWAFPLMAFPNLWPLLFKLPALFLLLIVQLAVLTYFQPRVTISKSKIVLHQKKETQIANYWNPTRGRLCNAGRTFADRTCRARREKSSDRLVITVEALRLRRGPGPRVGGCTRRLRQPRSLLRLLPLPLSLERDRTHAIWRAETG